MKTLIHFLLPVALLAPALATPPNTGSLARSERKTGVPPVMEDSASRPLPHSANFLWPRSRAVDWSCFLTDFQAASRNPALGSFLASMGAASRSRWTPFGALWRMTKPSAAYDW